MILFDVAFFGVILYLAYSYQRRLVWLTASFVLLCAYSYFTLLSHISLIILWALWLLVASFVLIKSLRCWIFSKGFMTWFVASQPAINPIEQAVLESGGSWWECDVFSGSPNWNKIHQQVITPLSTEEQSFLDTQVQILCDMLNEWEINHKYNDLPPQAWDYIKKEKFWAICMDVKYGGLGFSHAAHSAIVTKIATASISAAYTVMVPNSLGPAELITSYGSIEQKAYYLPLLATGKEIGCFGLTSVHAGSDAANIPDRGVVCRGTFKGEDVLGIKLHFDKRYITLAPVATLIALAFRLFDPDHLLGHKEDIGITVALLQTDLPGVTSGDRHSPLFTGFMNGPITGRNVFIPLSQVIGGPDNCGHGWKILMSCLAVGRGISMPALATAVANQCYTLAGAYAQVRCQFKQEIGNFEGIKEGLAYIGGMSYLIEANRYCLVQAVADGARPSVAAAITKYHLTEISRRVLEKAMDIHSGHAIQTGPGNLLAEVYLGLPVSTVGEGANIMTRNLIIFGQGVMRAHPFIKDEILAAVNNNDLKAFDTLILRHLGMSVAFSVRGIINGLTCGRLMKAPASPLRYYYRHINLLSNAFVLASDLALAVLGKKLKATESISARLADILSHLYLGLSVLKYSHDHEESAEEQVYAKWALQYCLYQSGQAFEQFFANFPNRVMANILKRWLFPWGCYYAFPKDKIAFAIADSTQMPSKMRKRLTRFCYIGKNPKHPVKRVLVAWEAKLEVITLTKKIDSAIQDRSLKRELTYLETIESAFRQEIITEGEKLKLVRVENLREMALVVDEFAFDDILRSNAGSQNAENLTSEH